MVYNHVSIDTLPLPILLISEARTLLAINKTATALFGRFDIGCDISDVIGNSRFLDACERVIISGLERDCEIVRKKHAKRRFQAHLSPFSNADRHGVFVVFHETTAAYEAEKMRSSFVADVSHELRSPLTTMIATIETLKGSAGNKPDVRARFIDLMADETNRMHRIVDDLLSLSATEANEHITPKDTVNLAPIAANVAEVLSIKAESKNMPLVLDIEKGLPDILGDKDELYQVIYNLADNAVKYGADGSTVTLAARSEAETVIFHTQNFGALIKKKHIPRLTERFYRADKSRSRCLGGTGLGLAIVKHIVNRHLGKMDITSDEPNGTIFEITFPRK